MLGLRSALNQPLFAAQRYARLHYDGVGDPGVDGKVLIKSFINHLKRTDWLDEPVEVIPLSPPHLAPGGSHYGTPYMDVFVADGPISQLQALVHWSNVDLNLDELPFDDINLYGKTVEDELSEKNNEGMYEPAFSHAFRAYLKNRLYKHTLPVAHYTFSTQEWSQEEPIEFHLDQAA